MPSQTTATSSTTIPRNVLFVGASSLKNTMLHSSTAVVIRILVLMLSLVFPFSNRTSHLRCCRHKQDSMILICFIPSKIASTMHAPFLCLSLLKINVMIKPYNGPSKPNLIPITLPPLVIPRFFSIDPKILIPGRLLYP
jgi:hypothetical protein